MIDSIEKLICAMGAAWIAAVLAALIFTGWWPLLFVLVVLEVGFLKTLRSAKKNDGQMLLFVVYELVHQSA